MNLETLKAFTLTDDHTAQEEVWQQIPSWNRDPANTVRQLLSRDAIPANDRCVRFVGLREYEADAGLVRRDLFAEGEHGTYILDAVKLNRLTAEKLERLAEREKADGWKWIEIQPDLDRQSVSRLRRLQPERVPLPEKVQKKIRSLEAKRDKFQQEAQQSDDNASDALWVQVDVLDEKIRDFQATAQETYSAATKAQSGVVVSVGSQGEPEYTRGLLRKEDEKALQKSSSAAETNHPSAETLTPEAEPETKGYSAALVESLTQHKTAAIAVEFMRQPQTALAATVHAFVLSHFHLDLHLYRSQTSIQISTTLPHLGDAADSAAGQALLAHRRE
jgi:ParB family chromosome partitioning protein